MSRALISGLCAPLFAGWMMMLSACGSTYDDPSDRSAGGGRGAGDLNPGRPYGARMIQDLSQRPPCIEETQGLLIYRMDAESFEVCAAQGWALVDIDGETGPQGPQGPEGERGGQGPQGASGPMGSRGEPGVSASTATVFLYDRDGGLVGFPDWSTSAREIEGAVGVFLNSGFYLELFTGTGLARANNEILQPCFFEQPNCQGECRVSSPNQLAYGESNGESVSNLRKPNGPVGGGFTAASAWGKGSCKISHRTLSLSYATSQLEGYPYSGPLNFRLQVR